VTGDDGDGRGGGGGGGSGDGGDYESNDVANDANDNRR
jgi:hypothetical protein